MNKKYKKQFDIACAVFQDECQAEISPKEDFGTTIFPWLKTKHTKSGDEYYLMYNCSVEIILSLYDMAMMYRVNTGKAISHYILFYECLRLDEYDYARSFLDSFIKDVNDLKLREIMAENDHKSNNFMYHQILFTFLHEISHQFYHDNQGCHATATATTKKVLESLKGPYTELFTEENIEKLLDRDDVKNFIKSQIPENSTKEEIRSIVEQYVAMYQYLTDLSSYIDHLLDNGDMQFLDEMTCDRYAFLIFLRWVKKQKLSPEATASLHQILYIAFSAMDNVKVLQTYCNPPKGKEMPYDPRQIVIRHRALLTNDLFYLGNTYKDVQKTYEQLDSNLDILYMTALSTMRSYEEQIRVIQERRDSLKKGDEARISAMTIEMESVVSELLKNSKETTVLMSIPMSVEDFVDDRSIFSLLWTYAKVKVAGVFRRSTR